MAFLLNNLVESVLGVVEAACILAIVARLSLSAFAMLCAALPLCAITYAAFRKRITRAAGETKEVAAKYSGANQKQCASAAFVKLNGLFALSSAFVGDFFRETLAGFLGYKRLCASLEASIGAIQLAASLFLFVACGSLVVQGRLSLGSFTAINAYLAMLVGVTGSLVASGRAAIEARAAARRMDELLSEPRGAGGRSVIGGVNAIEISGLGFEIGNGRRLYGDLRCAFRKGEFVCVTGENGSGKTSLLKAMLGAYADYEGEILVDGVELRELDLEAFRADLAAYLPQAPCLFFETADEIMGLGGRVKDAGLCASIASRLLARPDPRAFIEARLEEGRGSAEASFSGGERQNIAFAVACARRAQLTLLDEPTSAMDAASAAIAGGIMRELAREGIVICVSHDEAVIGMADRVLRL